MEFGWERGFVTKVIHMCTSALVRNQYMKLPTGGIMLGYFFLFRSSAFCGDTFGPGK